MLSIWWSFISAGRWWNCNRFDGRMWLCLPNRTCRNHIPSSPLLLQVLQFAAPVQKVPGFCGTRRTRRPWTEIAAQRGRGGGLLKDGLGVFIAEPGRSVSPDRCQSRTYGAKTVSVHRNTEPDSHLCFWCKHKYILVCIYPCMYNDLISPPWRQRSKQNLVFWSSSGPDVLSPHPHIFSSCVLLFKTWSCKPEEALWLQLQVSPWQRQTKLTCRSNMRVSWCCSAD